MAEIESASDCDTNNPPSQPSDRDLLMQQSKKVGPTSKEGMYQNFAAKSMLHIDSKYLPRLF